MKRMRSRCLHAVACLLALPAQAQTARVSRWTSPTRRFRSRGFDVQNKGLSLTVSRDPKGDDCEARATPAATVGPPRVILRDDQIDFTNIVTTRKMCGKPR